MRDFKQIVKGLRFKPNDGGSNPIGDLSGVLTAADNGSVYQYQNRLKAFLDGVEREIITNDQTQTLTNKTIDVDSNTVTNIELDNLKAGVLNTTTTLTGASDTQVASALAIKTYVDDSTASKDEADEIAYDNATSGLAATQVQAAIDEVEGRLDTAETDISDHISNTTGAHAASAISNIPAGNLAATDIQGAVNELQSDIDTRALDSDLTDHVTNTTGAHASSAISYDNTISGLTAVNVKTAIDEVEGRLDTVETAAGTAQTDIDDHIADAVDAHDASAISNVPAGNLAATEVQGALNELQSDVDTRALDSDLTTHTSATEAHGATGAVVGTTNTQTLTNKTLTGASIESPIRSDVKKDTKANLETYATTATDGQLCFATDEQTMYQVIDSVLAEIGSGGVGSVDIMFADQFDSTAIADYAVTGTVALTEDVLEVLQGKKSLEILHTGGASAERIIPVDIKFRGKNVTLSLDVTSTAQSGNLTLTVTDETNVATLINAESIQPQEAGQTSVKRSVSFNIPSDCESLKYRFNAVSEAAVTSIIDNVVIELTETARLSTTIEVPIITEWVDAGPITITATTTNPTKATTKEHDRVKWRQVGEEYEVEYEYRADSAAGALAGSGTYLFSLPSGVEFDGAQTLATIQTYTGLANNAQWYSPEYGAAKIGTGRVVGILAAGTVDTVEIFAVSGNRFQVTAYNIGVPNAAHINSTFFALTNANTSYTFRLKFKGKNLTATETQSVSLAQTVLVQESDSQTLVTGNAGQVITVNVTDIPFSNASSKGDAINWNGNSFTVNKNGVFNIDSHIIFATSAVRGIDLYENGLYKTRIGTLTIGITGGSVSLELEIGKTYSIRVADNGGTLANQLQHYIRITQQGSLKQLNVSENQKIDIPTSELRMEGATTRGTGSNSSIVRFDNIAKLRGVGFAVESTAALGTVVTIKKKGKLDIGVTLAVGSSVFPSIARNQAVLTTVQPSEILAGGGSAVASMNAQMKWSGDVNIGDILRVVSSANPVSSVANNLNLSFQEQQVSVSVTNVLPQFSESDSSVRVDTANGYGSTFTRVRRFSNVRDNIGADIERIPSDVNGDRFFVKSSGLYTISYSDSLSVAANLGIAKNVTDPSWTIDSVPQALKLKHTTTASASFASSVATEVYLQEGDFVVGLTSGEATGVAGRAMFTISKVGKPNVTGVDVTPFAKIEYEVTDYLYVSRSSFGTNGGFTVLSGGVVNKFTNKGIISYNPSNGAITALKPCTISADFSGIASAAGGVYVYISDENGSYSNGDFSSAGTGQEASISKNLTLSVGQSFSARIYNQATAHLRITAREQREAYQVIGGGIENTYSATIANNGSATLVSQSHPFIESVTRTALGKVRVVYKSGFFGAVRPAVSATPFATFNNVMIDSAHTYNNSEVTIKSIFENGSADTDGDFTIMVQRQGDDYRTPSKAIGLPAQRVAYIKDVKAANTSGGTFNSGSWQTRTLNTLVDPTGMVTSLASNAFTLPTGVYDIEATSPAHRVNRHKAKIRNITDSSDAILGDSPYTASADNVSNTSIIKGRLVLSSSKSFELQHRAETSTVTFGLGVEANFLVDEVYAQVKITRIEE